MRDMCRSFLEFRAVLIREAEIHFDLFSILENPEIVETVLDFPKGSGIWAT